MVQGEKRKAKVEEDQEEEKEVREEAKVLTSSAVVESDDDDDEAKEDLTLKIVEKVKLSRTLKLANQETTNSIVLDVASASQAMKGKKNKKKKRLNLEAEAGDQIVRVLKEEESVETVKKLEAVDLAELGEPRDGNMKEEAVEGTDLVLEPLDANANEVSDNAVLRKLLRGPRYFDPPDSGWSTCYNCGEEGHITVNCTLLEKKKPCFVCGDLDHRGKQCPKGKACFICKKGGHRAKDCPDKANGLFDSSIMCLKCGDFGHDLFMCRNDYSPDDLKEIQCYVCKSYGHLCCVKFVDNGPRVISCYTCGEHDHHGFACSRVLEEDTNGTPSSCYKCGKEGHFVRECTKTSKKNRDLTSALRAHKSQNKLGSKSAQEFGNGNTHKEKVKHKEKGNLTPQKLKRRGGWIPEDPSDLYESKPREYPWKSLVNSSRHYRIPPSSYDSRSSARSSKFIHLSNPRTPVFQGLGTAYQQGFSGARFSPPGVTHHGASLMYGNPAGASQYPGGAFGNSTGVYGHPGRAHGHHGSMYSPPVRLYSNPGVYHTPLGMLENSSGTFGNARDVYGNNSSVWIRRNNWSHGNGHHRF